MIRAFLLLAATLCFGQFADRQPRYQLQVGDVMEVQFRLTPEFTQTLTIHPDGFVQLKSVEDLKLSGLSVAEARDAIAKVYAKILVEPEISIVLKEFEKPWFVVNGEVSKPGRFDLKGNVSLTDALAIAGGFTRDAKRGEVLLVRRISSAQYETKRIRTREILEKGHFEEDLALRSGDAVYVSRSPFANVERILSATQLGFILSSGVLWR
ncbi:polysaccharide biosynthesis/export family protein [Bryobacter aggregatus]|uniref:polysaccharide biosynthesis/export family protein n=1 Tax=Bryobacter aggregatus TaxID=360054 RepID=UPI0004E1B025|nr:polysaccharide biosynthesis/export family protein [Bryobacter aggregatus]